MLRFSILHILFSFSSFIYCKHEKRAHEVEHGAFTPLVLSISSGMACEAIYKQLAEPVSHKWEENYLMIRDSFSSFMINCR